MEQLSKPAVAAGRSWNIDLLKTIAIVGVVCIHISAAGLSNPLGSPDWLASVFWGSLTRGSVPLFFLCSGALLLDPNRDLTLKKLYGKRMLRLLAALFFWAMAYAVFRLAMDGALSPPTLWQAAKEVLLFRHENHLYYLHIALLFYAFLPVTRLFVRHADRRLLEYALGLWFLLGILYPTLSPLWPFTLLRGIPQQWQMNMTYASIGYGALGYYLQAYPPRGRTGAVLALLGFGLTFGGALAISLRQGALYQHLWEGMSVGVCLLATGIYALCVTSRAQPSGQMRAILARCSQGSFCVYLVHVFVISLFARAGLTVALAPCLVSIPLVVCANLLCSGLIYLLLSRVPVVNKWLI